ncbi:MAG: hypothetical protein ABIQ32_06535 [Sphingomicrobium sp.]
MRSRLAGITAALIATGAVAAPQFVPTGATIEASGFATVEKAPHVPYPDEPPPSDNRPRTEAEWYARDQGISIEEARKRQIEQQALMPVFERLLARLRVSEAGNYTSARMIHSPDWGYELYFKRDPEHTLALYTVNPRFKARLARYTQAELQALVKPWTDRFKKHGIAEGISIDDTYGTAQIMMNVSEEEYRALSGRENWGPVPEPVKLLFAGGLLYPAIEERARPFIRTFGHNDRATTIQLEGGFTGKIVMRGGCLRSGTGKDAPLAFFHKETGIGVDEQGYLVLTDRRTGKSKGRIGEWFSWAGPNSIPADHPAVKDLQSKCGTAPVVYVGSPESEAQFRARPYLVDSIAERKRVSRKRAWELLKQCWARQEAQRPDRPPDENCVR